MALFEQPDEIKQLFNYSLNEVEWSGEYEGPSGTFALYFLEDEEALESLAEEREAKTGIEGLGDKIRGLKGYWIMAGMDGDLEYFDSKGDAVECYEKLKAEYNAWLERGDDDE